MKTSESKVCPPTVFRASRRDRDARHAALIRSSTIRENAQRMLAVSGSYLRDDGAAGAH